MNAIKAFCPLYVGLEVDEEKREHLSLFSGVQTSYVAV